MKLDDTRMENEKQQVPTAENLLVNLLHGGGGGSLQWWRCFITGLSFRCGLLLLIDVKTKARNGKVSTMSSRTRIKSTHEIIR